VTAPTDTIAAVATAPGEGGIAVVRISGPDAVRIVSETLGKGEGELADRQVVVGVARHPDGARIDTVLAFVLRGPRSFTGEDVAELHGHGGAVNSARLLRAVLARGARPASPGEFTRRAFEHGKLDLPRAEALAAVIGAGSERAWRVAQDQLAGALGRRVAALRAEAVEVLAEIEAAIDFPEEGLELPAAAGLAARCADLAARCGELAATFRAGRALRDGLVVALAGPVNAGKSSLFNALLGRERAIVSAAPGTTRDYVEARTEWHGVAVTLVDTAGARETVDEVERRGMALAADRVATADVVLWLSEAVAGDGGVAQFGARGVLVRSKADLASGGATSGAIATSVVDGRGLAEVRGRVLGGVGADDSDAAGVVVTSERQRDAIARAGERLAAAGVGLAGGQPLEAAAIDARDGARALAEVLGDEVGEDVLDALFARFCIGK